MKHKSIHQRLGEHEIRLIKILPCFSSYQCEEIVRCIIKVVSLENTALQFNALSYTWRRDAEYEVDEAALYGTSDSPKTPHWSTHPFATGTIQLRSYGSGVVQKVQVQYNLLSALRRFREEAFQQKSTQTSSRSQEGRYRYDGWLWIDALCINQDDIIEKGRQVPQMLQIYKKAEVVVCWLGIEAINGLDKLGEFLKYLENDATRPSRNLISNGDSTLRLICQDPTYNDCWDALRTIYEAKYWARIWIVQELLGNPCSKVHVGQSLVDLYQLLRLGEMVTKLKNPFKPIELSPMSKIYLESQRASFPPSDLLELLRRCRQHQCSVPHDKVYALIGMALPYAPLTSTRLSLVVDYSLSLYEMNKAVAKYIIMGSGSLEVIRNPEIVFCNCSKSSHRDSGLPSWVTDWNCEGKLAADVHMHVPSIMEPHSWQFDEDSISFSPDGEVLQCKGHLLGRAFNLFIPKPSPANTRYPILSQVLKFLVAVKLLEPPNDPSILKDSDIKETCSQIYQVLELYLSGRRDLPYHFRNDRFARKDFFLEACFEIFGRLYEGGSEYLADLYMPHYEGWCEEALASLLSNKRLFTVHANRESGDLSLDNPCYALGIGEAFAQPEDVIVLFRGCRSPIMLRPNLRKRGTFTVVGEVRLAEFPGAQERSSTYSWVTAMNKKDLDGEETFDIT